MKLAEVAGLSLTPPRLIYEAADASWGSASLTRPHLARVIGEATLAVRPPGGETVATFPLQPWIHPAVEPYMPPPAATWRVLVVDQRLLSRPDLIWTGAFPKEWEEALGEALTALHRRYLALFDERWLHYGLRQIECAECRAERLAKLPPNLPPWHFQMRSAPSGRCPHVPAALRAVDALCRAHPELTFEVLGWMEPAGARVEAEGPEPSRFALTGKVMDALLGPWLVGEAQRPPARTSFRGHDWYRYSTRWGRAPDPHRPALSREQHNGVALAASAWGFTEEATALVAGDATAAEPELDRKAAPAIETPAAAPGERVRRRSRRRKDGS